MDRSQFNTVLKFRQYRVMWDYTDIHYTTNRWSKGRRRGSTSLLEGVSWRFEAHTRREFEIIAADVEITYWAERA